MADTTEKEPKQAGQAGQTDPGQRPRARSRRLAPGPPPEAPARPSRSRKKSRRKAERKKPAEGKPAAPAEPEGPPPSPRPARLHDYYEQRVRPKLAQQFGLTNPTRSEAREDRAQRRDGDASKNPKALEAAVAELAAITGQQPVVTRAKKRSPTSTCARACRSAAR